MLFLIVVYHCWIDAHALYHAACAASLITVLVVQLFDELEKIVVDLRLVSLSYLFLLFSVDMNLCFEHSLAVWRAMLWRASSSATLRGSYGLQGTLRYLRRDHRAIRSLLFDCDDHFAVALGFGVRGLRHALSNTSLSVFRGVWWSIQIGIFLRLILHFELREESLFKLCLLRGAYRLAGNLLHVIELVEEVLVEVVPIVGPGTITPKVHIVIGAVCALVPEARLNRAAILVVLTA